MHIRVINTGLGFRGVVGFKAQVWDLGFRIQGLRFRVQCSGLSRGSVGAYMGYVGVI